MKLKRTLLPMLVGLGAMPSCKEPAPDVTPTSQADAGKKPTITIRADDPIPQRLGGAVAPMPPRPQPTPKRAAPSPAMAPPGAAAAAPAPAAAPSPSIASVEVVHNHPPGEPCHPLTEDEVKRALGDVRKQ